MRPAARVNQCGHGIADPATEPLLAAIDAALAGGLDATGMAGALIDQAEADLDKLTARLLNRYPDIAAAALQHLFASLPFIADLFGAASPSAK